MRAANSLLGKDIYEFDQFRLNAMERTLECGGRPVSLSPKALDVLIVLVERRGHIVEKEELLRRVWPETFVEENNLAFNISVLRKVLTESGATVRYIETVPKRGYRFMGEGVTVAQEPEILLPPEPAAVPASPRTGSRWKYLGAGVAVLLIGILGYGLFRLTTGGKTRLGEMDTIVLADFVNNTGETIFDGTLYQGLAAELGQSPFLSLISQARVRRTLAQMRQTGDSRLTPELAREVCQRTGGAVVLAGSIGKVGEQYVLGLRATSCVSGATVDNEQVQVLRKEDVLGALNKMTYRFRVRSGESAAMLEKHNVPLAEATTSSLDALKAYSDGWKIHLSRGATEAMPSFKRATELDPEFAMAHASLGRIYADLDLTNLAADSLRKAWQLRDRAGDREKFFITANYQILWLGNLEEARKTCEAWARTYSRDALPHLLLAGGVDRFSGKYEHGIAEDEKAISLDPDFGIGYYGLAVNNSYLERIADAEEVLRRAAGRGLQSDEFLMLGFDLAFLKNDHARMEQIAGEVRKRSGPESWISNNQAAAYAYDGQLQKARSLSAQAVAEAQQGGQGERADLWNTSAAIREALFGNHAEAKEKARAALTRSKDAEVEYGSAFALALAGDVAQSQGLVASLEKRFPSDTNVQFYYVPVVRAQIALAKGDPLQALHFLQTAAANELGTPRSIVHGYFGGLYPVWVRGQAYLALGRGKEAACEFEKILAHRGIVTSDAIGAFARLQLGRAHALTGDKSHARDAYADFLHLWKDADANLKMLQQAKAELGKLQ